MKQRPEIHAVRVDQENPVPLNDPTIRIMCPTLGCQRVLGVPAHARGKIVRCRACGSMVRVPAPKSPVEPAAKTPGAQPDANDPPTAKPAA